MRSLDVVAVISDDELDIAVTACLPGMPVSKDVAAVVDDAGTTRRRLIME